jgi:hypothetical protein
LLEGGVIAFTGRLASMKRTDAFALVIKHGGKPRKGITKNTCVLVVGELGWLLQDDGRPSKSLGQARSYGVPIASERRFIPREEQTKSYTAGELASLSKLSADIVEQLAMFGLIEARGSLYGFGDLASARQVARLLSSGIGLSVITRSLRDIRQWLPDARLSNVRLFPESSDKSWSSKHGAARIRKDSLSCPSRGPMVSTPTTRSSKRSPQTPLLGEESRACTSPRIRG